MYLGRNPLKTKFMNKAHLCWFKMFWKDIMVLFLLMDKLDVAKLIQWQAAHMNKKEELYLALLNK